MIIIKSPCIWHEGYYIDDIIDEARLKSLIKGRVEFKELADNEQRLVFFYQRQLIVDIIIMRDEVNFDISAGEIDDKWFSRSSSDGALRLYR